MSEAQKLEEKQEDEEELEKDGHDVLFSHLQLAALGV